MMLQYNIFYVKQNEYDSHWCRSYKTYDEAIEAFNRLVSENSTVKYKLVIEY